jgi:hypothetical protein
LVQGTTAIVNEGGAKFRAVAARMKEWYNKPHRTRKCPWLGEYLPSLFTYQDKNKLSCGEVGTDDPASFMKRVRVLNGMDPDRPNTTQTNNYLLSDYLRGSGFDYMIAKDEGMIAY